MAIQLTKIITDQQIDEWREQVTVSVSVLGVPTDAVQSFDLTHEQFGGTFSATLEGQVNSYSFFEGQVLPVLTIGSTVYTGKINKITSNVGKSGISLSVSGELRPLALAFTANISFSSADPFFLPSGDFIPGPVIPNIDNHYRLLGLSASSVVSVLSQRSGIPISTPLPYSYPIWRFEAGSSSILEAMDTVAQFSAANAVLRLDGGTSSVAFIPWASTLGAVEVDFSDLLSDLKIDREQTEFTHVVLNPSSDMTPWNSTYAGVPEPFGELSFQASGTASGNDISVAVATEQSSDDWIYPETGFNQWVTYSTLPGELNLHIYRDYGVSGFWKAVQFDTLNTWITYSTLKASPQGSGSSIVPDKGATGFGALAEGVNSGTVSQAEVVNRTVPATLNKYKVLLSWDLAVKRFKQQGDMLPYLALIPSSETSPDFVANFDVDSGDLFNIQPVGFSRMPENLDGDNPPEVGAITPRTFVAEAYSNPTLTGLPDFSDDGSFFIGIKPHNYFVRVGRGGYDKVSDTATTETFPGFTVQVPALIDTRKFKPETDSAGAIVDGTTEVADQTFEVSITYPGGADETEKNAALTDLREQISSKGLFLLELGQEISPASDGATKLQINESTGLLDTIAGEPTLKFLTHTLPDEALTLTSVVVSAEKTGIFGESRIRPWRTEVVASSVSGTVDVAKEPLTGSWKLFAFKRKVFTPVVWAEVGNSVTPAFSYTGQLPTFLQNPKTVFSGLITDFWGGANQLTHAARFVKALSNYLSQEFIAYETETMYNNESYIGQPGDKITVKNYPGGPNHPPGNVISKITSIRISGSPSEGIKIFRTGGRLKSI